MAETRVGNPKLPEKLREAGKQVGREEEMKRGRKEGKKGIRQETVICKVIGAIKPEKEEQTGRNTLEIETGNTVSLTGNR